MSYFDDPFDPYARARQRGGWAGRAYAQHGPTLEDFKQLEKAYRELTVAYQELAKQNAASQEALKEQTKRAMQIQADLEEAQQTIDTLTNKIEEMEANETAALWQERYRQLQAETETYRLRLEQRMQAEADRQRNQILEAMLPLADHLEMGLNHLKTSGDDSNQQSFVQNIQATLRAFLESLRKYGVEPIASQGEPFDPELHEAVARLPDEEIPEDHVAAVVRTGYSINERLLRPAQVVVSSGSSMAHSKDNS